MRTWNDYKRHVKEVDPEMGHEISKIEENTEIIKDPPEDPVAIGTIARG